MNDIIRKAFEKDTTPSFSSGCSYPYNVNGRDENGCYINSVIEDHWQTFQEGWDAAIVSIKNTPIPDLIRDTI